MSCVRCHKDFGRIMRTLRDANGERAYCPNCMAIAWHENEIELENDSSLIDDITERPGAVEFKSYNEQYVLEKTTMLRLISYNLRRHEYTILSRKYGADKYMLHDDFYWNDGYALQPM